MDILRLRTLSRKSLLNFGKYADCTVQNLLDLKKTNYLRWVYYNASMISFLPDILEEIHIPDEYLIEKPGKEPEKHNELTELLSAKMLGITKLKHKSHIRKIKKGKMKHKFIKDSIKYSKSRLQSKNHGH